LEQVPNTIIQAAPQSCEARRSGASLSVDRRGARLKRRAIRIEDSIENTAEETIDVPEFG
jgi:hypothetical protein